MLYECLAGEPPFDGRDAAELGFAHLVEPPPDPRERRPELPADLALALLTALEKEPAERPTTATALARMLHLARTLAPPDPRLDVGAVRGRLELQRAPQRSGSASAQRPVLSSAKPRLKVA